MGSGASFCTDMMFRSLDIILVIKSLSPGDNLSDGSDDDDNIPESFNVLGITVSEWLVRGISCSVDTLSGFTLVVIIMCLRLSTVSSKTSRHSLLSSFCCTSYSDL